MVTAHRSSRRKKCFRLSSEFMIRRFINFYLAKTSSAREINNQGSVGLCSRWKPGTRSRGNPGAKEKTTGPRDYKTTELAGKRRTRGPWSYSPVVLWSCSPVVLLRRYF